MRALVVTNMWPSASEPVLGRFVRDQVEALRELDGVEVEVFAFPPGGYLRAARELRRRIAASASTSSTRTSASRRGPRSRCAARRSS